jgi:hypothetical protein
MFGSLTAPSLHGNNYDGFDALFLRRNHSTPLVVLPWRVWAAILSKVRP